jgi:hypothetical protein
MLGASSNSCCASSTAAEGAASSARLGCTSGDGGAAEGAASSARLACTSGDGGAELSLSESELVESSPASCRAGATFGTSPFCLRHSRKQKGKPAMTSTTANVQATARRIALVETIICVAVDSRTTVNHGCPSALSQQAQGLSRRQVCHRWTSWRACCPRRVVVKHSTLH